MHQIASDFTNPSQKKQHYTWHSKVAKKQIPKNKQEPIVINGETADKSEVAPTITIQSQNDSEIYRQIKSNS